MAAACEEALGKKVTYTRITYDDAKKSYLGMGYPEWQVNGLVELLKLVDEGDPVIAMENVGDYEKITVEKPTELKTWMAKSRVLFNC